MSQLNMFMFHLCVNTIFNAFGLPIPSFSTVQHANITPFNLRLATVGQFTCIMHPNNWG